MIRRVTLAGFGLRSIKLWSRSEGESEEGDRDGGDPVPRSAGVGPKPGELPMGRVQRG